MEELEKMNLKRKEESSVDETNIESSGDVSGEIVNKDEIMANETKESGEVSGEIIAEEINENISGEIIEKEEIVIDEIKESGDSNAEIVIKEEKEVLSNEERYQKARALQETKIQTVRLKPLMLHIQQNNKELYSIRIALIRSQG